jgi:hypothetical protein
MTDKQVYKHQYYLTVYSFEPNGKVIDSVLSDSFDFLVEAARDDPTVIETFYEADDPVPATEEDYPEYADKLEGDEEDEEGNEEAEGA